MPARSTALSRFLAALTPEPVESLRTLILEDLLARSLGTQEQVGGLWDRAGLQWVVFDVDGTPRGRSATGLASDARTPCVSQTLARAVCPWLHQAQTRGGRADRTTALQAHEHRWLGSIGGPGNGKFREELRRVVVVIGSYLSAHHLPQDHALLRLDGQYGTMAVVADLAELSYVMRGKKLSVA